MTPSDGATSAAQAGRAPATEAELTLPADQTAALLNLVNDPSVTAETLQAAGATSTASKALVTARAGADGVCPSGDDFFFTSVAQVDAVPGVGDATLQKWANYGVAHPSVGPETVKGVFFKGWQVRAVSNRDEMARRVNEARDVLLKKD